MFAMQTKGKHFGGEGKLLHSVIKPSEENENVFGTAISTSSAGNLIEIPDVDRNKGDSNNLIAIVLEVSDDQMYKLGTKSGILSSLYSRNQLNPCQQKFLRTEDVPDVKIILRSSAIAQSRGSGQGFVRCN